MFDSLPGGGLKSVIKVRTWSTHTVELGDVLVRMNNMLWRARRFFIGATIYGVLERPTFAVCLWVVHLEPHLLDNMGPLTRDTAVRRGVSLTRGLPRTFVGLACDTEDWAVYILAFNRGDVRFYVVIGTTDIRETHLLLCRSYDSRLLVYSINV